MSMTVNTNAAAMVALQNLNATTRQLDVAQTRISTGLEVTGAKDNAAVYAIAQNMRGDVSALNAIDQSLDRAISTIDVAIAAGEAISDIIVQMKEKVLAAADTSLDTTSRAALNEDFVALRDQISSIVNNANFNGVNLINGSLTSITVLASADAQQTIRIQDESLVLGSGVITMTATSSIGTQSLASAMIATVNESLQNVNSALARLGSGAKQVETHINFISKLQDSLEVGVGNLVDANLADESARLQALQVKQQLGVQALSIANSRPQIVLSLFGG